MKITTYMILITIITLIGFAAGYSVEQPITERELVITEADIIDYVVGE